MGIVAVGHVFFNSSGVMHTIYRFGLEPHEAPYESWPLRSGLLLDGQKTPLRVPGYVLLHQFETQQGYLLITDCDCPFEEATSFILLSKALRLLACRTLSAPYESFLLERIEWLDASRCRAIFSRNDSWLVTLHSWGIPLVRPRLQLRCEYSNLRA
ncbi:MAG: hypothetical protein R3F53_00730 [Gammaproteobacteria bacterium]